VVRSQVELRIEIKVRVSVSCAEFGNFCFHTKNCFRLAYFVPQHQVKPTKVDPLGQFLGLKHVQ